MSEAQIDEAKVSKEAFDNHYSSLSGEDKKAFDALDDTAKESKKKEIGSKAVEQAKEEAKKKETVPLATLLEERKQKKLLEEKLASIEGDAKTKAEKELQEKGEFKTLAEKKTAELEEATKKLATAEGLLKVFTDATEKKVTDFISKVKEEDKQIVEAVLNGKTIAEKEALLPSLIKKFGSPEDINASAGGSGDKKKQNALELEEAKKELEKAKKAGKPMDVLKFQKVIRELEAQGKK